MPADPEAPNTLSPAVRNRSVAAGDIPERLRRRYYLDERGGAGLGFYVDAKIEAPSFRDRGRQLVSARTDPNAIRDMVSIAQHRGWTVITARGSADFRREAWLAGRRLGLEVHGHRPTERDLQELQRRLRPRERPAPTPERDEAGVRSRLAVVDTVVRGRVRDPIVQDRILASARARIAEWLERGAHFDVMPTSRERGTPRGERAQGRER